jgi:DNA-binding beta-propeller fold protein YncE
MLRRKVIFDRVLAALALLAFCPLAAWAEDAATADARLPARALPGAQPDGSVLLPNQWSLRPAGRQIEVGNFPVNVALHPRGQWAVVLHSGYGPHAVVVVEVATRRIVSSVIAPKTFYGLCFSPDGERLYASGGEDDVVHEFHFADGYLYGHKVHELPKSKTALVAAGLACSVDGSCVYAACCLGDRLCILHPDHAGDLGQIGLPARSYPYLPVVARKTNRLYLSLWGKSAVAVIDLDRRVVSSIWPSGSHPTEMALSPDEETLYVACADQSAVSVLDTRQGRELERIGTSLYPKVPNGSTPNSLALAPNGNTLWVANADANNLAVFDVSQRGQGRALGFLPVGWYPTSVRISAAADCIFVANGKGLTSKANRNGPNPLLKKAVTKEEYIGGLLPGALSVIHTPELSQMASLTATAYACCPVQSDGGPTSRPPEPDNPVPGKLGQPSPIKHCIYIIKENRTYDQVFGDIPQGNGDPGLCIFPERVTPNHHALARQFVLLDNFYVDGEVSANGHEWSMAAYATDYVEKVWPLAYRGGNVHAKDRSRGFEFPSEGAAAIACPSSGYLWDRCRGASVSYRSYGEFIENGSEPADPGHARVKALEGHFDPHFRSFDLDYSDQRRADRFIAELQRFEAEGRMPQLMIVRLPSDHTAGAKAGMPTPTAYVADNDLALGRVVEAVSHSKFWPETAVFVLEDDAQNGPDHVDAHRSIAVVVSPYTKRHAVDSSMYSTSSMLRTMELILGLKPMTQFDAAARPMYGSFRAQPDLTPFTHLPAQVDLDERNSAEAWGAADSAKMDFREADAADDQRLNEIIWRSVRGAESPMPPPVRSAFFLPHPGREKGDD